MKTMKNKDTNLSRFLELLKYQLMFLAHERETRRNELKLEGGEDILLCTGGSPLLFLPTPHSPRTLFCAPSTTQQ